MMKIIDVKSQALVQDLGRNGWRKLGIRQTGAMDKLALSAGNLLLGNEVNAPAIEIALGSLKVEFQQPTHFCITGAFYQIDLDGKPVHAYWRYPVDAGQVLNLQRAKFGMYAYLCVEGGFDIPLELGSASTDLLTNLGGVQGRALQVGDCLSYKKIKKWRSKIGIAPIPLKNTIMALPSSEYDYFSLKSKYHWWQNKWRLLSNSNRIGYRFQGEPLNLHSPLEMLSHAIQFGTVQVPPDGQPIILMADSQITGGYPKIACVIDADLGSLAQVRLGTEIQFKMVSLKQAQLARQKNEVYLNHIRRIFNETD